MKNLKVVAFAFLFGTVGLFASELVPDIPVKQISTQVVDLFENPDFKIEAEQVVNIRFTFSSEGDIVILDVDSKNPEIIKYIRDTMNHKIIETPGEAHRVFSLPLRIQENK